MDNIPFNGTTLNDDTTMKQDIDSRAEDLISYSHNMTKALFANQMFVTPSNKYLYSSDYDWPNKLKSIREKQMFKPLLDNITKSTHPLAKFSESASLSDTSMTLALRNADQTQAITSDNLRSDASNKLQQVAKSARALIMPHLNAIDKKKLALDKMVKPQDFRPWKLYRVISGSGGVVNCVCVEPANDWFASGSADGLIRIYDLARGKLRLSLTGHISGVRGLAISRLRPYMFSCAEDKTVKCWDLEQNHIVRHYHGHLSGVYCIGLHPQDNQLITGGRDSVARLWDVRSKEQIACMTGHKSTVSAIICQKQKPQFITASHDSTIRFWDMRNLEKSILTLTHHRKAVRALAFDNTHSGFLSASFDSIKQWTLPDGGYVKNFSRDETIINALAINENNVTVSGNDEGLLQFWDWRTGQNMQNIKCKPQPGSIESEAGIRAMAFDMSGTRLITGESDKTIKFLKETEPLPQAIEEN